MFRTLLLAGDANARTSALERNAQGLILDQQLNLLLQSGADVGVVLSGHECDEVLRQSRWLRYCELIFDTHFEKANLITNLASGLYTVKREAIALPLKDSLTPVSDITELVRLYLRQREQLGGAHLCQLQGRLTPSFPVMVTARGRGLIKHSDDLHDFSDPRLKCLTLVPDLLPENSQNTKITAIGGLHQISTVTRV